MPRRRDLRPFPRTVPGLVAGLGLVASFVAAPRLEAAQVRGVWCNQVDAAIPDADLGGIERAIVVSTGSAQSSIDFISVYVALDHTYVGDLRLTLVDPALGTRVLLQNPGSPCPEDDIAATFDDFGDGPADGLCDTTPRAIHGRVEPDEPFYLFQPRLLDGTWKLRIVDSAGSDAGTFRSWCLLSGVLFYDGFESGDPAEWSVSVD